jgi:hypothetical protein
MREELKANVNVRCYERDVRNGLGWNPVFEVHNTATTICREEINRWLLAGSIGEYVTHFGVGSGTTTESVSDTGNEFPIDITSAAEPHKSIDGGSNFGISTRYTNILLSTEPSVQPCNLTEISLFGAISGGSCWARATHASYTKTNTIELKYDWDITIT